MQKNNVGHRTFQNVVFTVVLMNLGFQQTCLSAIKDGDLSGTLREVKLVSFLDGMPIFAGKDTNVAVIANSGGISVGFSEPIKDGVSSAKKLSVSNIVGSVSYSDKTLTFTPGITMPSWDYLNVSLESGVSFADGWYGSSLSWRLRSLACYENSLRTDDSDRDGILDCTEQPGVNAFNLPLYEWGARVNRPDLFVQLDYMDNQNATTIDPALRPRKEALQKVVAAFNARGIGLHFDVGDLYDQHVGTNVGQFDLGAGNMIPYQQTSSLNDVINLRNTNLSADRRNIFYYMVFGNSQNANGSGGSSGIAELPGANALVTLGHWGLNTNSVANTNLLINYQAGTIMHEFGHNLNLRHGGNVNTNFKPNYISVMNYLYQLDGLPDSGVTQGDRYYLNYYPGNANCGSMVRNNLNNSPFSAGHRIDYSSGTRLNIDESRTDELLGLGFSPAFQVDFNCNGNANQILTSFDINRDTFINVLSDHNDWGNLYLRFSNSNIGATSGAFFKATAAEIVVEEQPSSQFFADLKNSMN